MHDERPLIGDYALFDSLTDDENMESDCEVYKAKSTKTNEEVILKISRYSDHEAREMEIHRLLRHEFIVNLLDSFKTPLTVRSVMVFEKYSRDLEELYAGEVLESNRIQKFMWQLMTGLQYVHEKGIMHRDIKPDNLMISSDDCLKIGDFGLARYTDPTAIMTPERVTVWYRPIEILLDCPNHNTAVDIWSAGCVMAEMYRRCPLFMGDGQISMINKIISVLGKPTLPEWPTMNELPVMKMIELDGSLTTKFEIAVPNASVKAMNLIKNMIKYDPERRFSAAQCLQNEYFKGEDTSERNQYEPVFP